MEHLSHIIFHLYLIFYLFFTNLIGFPKILKKKITFYHLVDI